MKDRVEIIQQESDFSRTVWVFFYSYGFGGGAVLDRWAHETRKTKRHKWAAPRDRVWARLDERNNTISRPDVPERVAAEALLEFSLSLTFKKGELTPAPEAAT